MAYVFLSRKQYAKKLACFYVPWKTESGKLMGHMWKADKPQALCFGWWTSPSMAGIKCKLLRHSYKQRDCATALPKSPNGIVHCTGLWSWSRAEEIPFEKVCGRSQYSCSKKPLWRHTPKGICCFGIKASPKIHVNHSVTEKKLYIELVVKHC